MCGIVGVLCLNESRISSCVAPSILEVMTNTITHRGPDSNGLWISKDKHCGFGFRRLSIIDLTPAGNQPMSTFDGMVTIVFNGEIYNYLQLREELIKKGYKFRSRTDTEVIINGYKEWGLEVVRKISGMFAFVLWDEKNQLLFGARDRIGKKPLYYYHNNDVFIFASEIKAILKHPLVSKEINWSELANYLNFGASSNRSTMFRNIYKVPPAHCFVLKRDKPEIHFERYWNPFEKKAVLDITEQEAISEIIRLLRVAIKDRMMSDVPFGVFLSGGIDSSLNVALMSELMDRPVDTFTIGFKELAKYNELEYARKIVEIFKTNHNEILIDDKDAFDVVQELVWYEDEPNADPVCIPIYFLSKLTRDTGTIVVQVGEGSDEQFVGYNWLLRDYKFYHRIWKNFDRLPSSLKKSFYFFVEPILKFFNHYLPLELIRRSSNNEEYYWSGISIFPPTEQEVLFNKKFRELKNVPWGYISSIYNEAITLSNGELDFLQWVTFVEISQRLPELLLMRIDKMGMANSIEARVPFLDYKIVEFTMSLPAKLKVPDGKTTKYLLKKAVEGILPSEIIYRKKQGFWAPINEWLRNQWFNFTYNILNNSNLLKEFINLEYVNYILQRHRAGKGQYAFRIFTLLNLALWYNKFFDNQPIKPKILPIHQINIETDSGKSRKV